MIGEIWTPAKIKTLAGGIIELATELIKGENKSLTSYWKQGSSDNLCYLLSWKKL
jgi:hypothetical protein